MTKAIKALGAIARANRQRADLIEQARQEGATWDQIAQATQMSRAGAIKLHATRAGTASPQDG